MAKKVENSDNSSVQNPTSSVSGKVVVPSESYFTITGNYEQIRVIEFLGLGKVTGIKYNIQVKTIKVGDKEIDASNIEGISCISRNADTLEISGECDDQQEQRSYLIEYEVEHYDPMSNMGDNSDYSSDNV